MCYGQRDRYLNIHPVAKDFKMRSALHFMWAETLFALSSFKKREVRFQPTGTNIKLVGQNVL
jgi:hypothetical protein